MFWRPFRPKDVARYLTAAERFERAGKKPGDRNGPLGTVAIEVLRELLRLVDYRTGRLEPALLTIMARTKRSKDAVVTALKALRRHGFIDWVRRYIPTGNLGAGPQVQQTSNAYRLALPPAAERLLGRAVEDAPMPDDHAHALEARQAERRAQLAGVDPEERNAALFGSGPLADAFSRRGQRDICWLSNAKVERIANGRVALVRRFFGCSPPPPRDRPSSGRARAGWRPWWARGRLRRV